MEFFTKSDGTDELQCRCGCGLTVDRQFRAKLNRARAMAETPFKINSGARCLEHNRKIGSRDTSSHISGLAADIHFSDSCTAFKILEALILTGFKRIGINFKANFIHVDFDMSKAQKVLFSY